jgi:DNA-binding transcriptional ArsR family regulator
MPVKFDDILNQDPELRKELIRELVSEDPEVREIFKSSLKEGIVREVISSDTPGDRNTAKRLLKMSLVESAKQSNAAGEPEKTAKTTTERTESSLITNSEREKLYEILNKINPPEKEKHAEQKEEKYSLSDLFTTMVVFGEKIGQSYSMIADERKNSNRILLNVNGSLDNLSEKMERVESKADVILGTPRHVSNSELLAEKDIEILNVIDAEGKVCADDLKEKFGYKNRNAASARLNRLEERGLLKKQYVGRTVYYTQLAFGRSTHSPQSQSI